MAYRPRFFATRRGQEVDNALDDTYEGLKAAQTDHTGKFRQLDEVTGRLVTSVGAIKDWLAELKKAEVIRRLDVHGIYIKLLWALNMAQWIVIYELLRSAKK